MIRRPFVGVASTARKVDEDVGRHTERSATPMESRETQRQDTHKKNNAGLGRQVVGHFLLSKLAPRRLPRVVLFREGTAGASDSSIFHRSRPSKIGKTLRGHDHAKRPVAHAINKSSRTRVVHVVLGRAEGRRPQPTKVVLHGSVW